MSGAFVHAKLMLSEGCAYIGSANLDLRSYYNQFENGVYFTSPSAMEEVLRDFEGTLEVCAEITAENAARNSLVSRIAAGVLRIFSPLM